MAKTHTHYISSKPYVYHKILKISHRAYFWSKSFFAVFIWRGLVIGMGLHMDKILRFKNASEFQVIVNSFEVLFSQSVV